MSIVESGWDDEKVGIEYEQSTCFRLIRQRGQPLYQGQELVRREETTLSRMGLKKVKGGKSGKEA